MQSKHFTPPPYAKNSNHYRYYFDGGAIAYLVFLATNLFRWILSGGVSGCSMGMESHDCPRGEEGCVALCCILFDDHFIFIGYAGDFMAVLFTHDGRLVLVFLGAIHFGKGDEYFPSKIQTFL